MPVKAELGTESIIVEAGFEAKDRLMTIPGARWDRQNGRCLLNISWASCKQLRAVCDTLDVDLEIGDSLLKWATTELESRIIPCNELRHATEVSHPSGLCDGLYPFQQAGAQFLVTARQCILADPMGSGKTVQAIAAARLLGTKSLPALIVCPNSMKRTWGREIEQWWPGLSVSIVQGTKKQRQVSLEPGHDFYIINWESVRLHSKLAYYSGPALPEEERIEKELNQIDWKLVVADEAHRMKDPQSKQTRAVWAASAGAEYRWAMTGTPLTATPDTMFPILYFLNRTEWPTKTKFIERYCDSAPARYGPGLDVFGLNEHMKEEFFEIFDPRFRRMPKEIVLPNLPPVVETERRIDMSEEQARGYATMVENMVAVDENGELIIAVNPVSKLTRLIQYSSACLEMNQETGQARLTGPSCKINQLMVDLDDYLGEGESIAVFAVHRQLIEMAEDALQEKNIPYSVIKGGQSESLRQLNIDDFQNGNSKVILVVIAAGGVGVTLTAARIGIWLQRSWSNVDHLQSRGRIHRIGSEIHESVIYVDYITNRTCETRQLAVLAGKHGQLENIVRDRETIEKLLRGEEDD